MLHVALTKLRAFRKGQALCWEVPGGSLGLSLLYRYGGCEKIRWDLACGRIRYGFHDLG